ncbi:MAG: TIGR03621 family F420-dependent LLM class oxidoreductase [Actinomycetota bacterium]|nr:MAG: TIGR03621 family F420-dependent LLM class oxidoreductase [Actinomycetota bacterium]
MRQFRFGVQASSPTQTGLEWQEIARKAESLGFSTLFVPDHLDDGQFSPIVAMTAAAMATRTLRVGSLVFDNDYRHPVLLAREMATLDLISEGRLEVGMGAGWRRSDYEQSGIHYDPPGVRISRLSEAVEIMVSLWREGTATLEGQHYSVNGAVGLPKPYAPQGPPLIIGGGGRKILDLAARYAQIVGINPSLSAGVIGTEVARTVGPENFLERVAWVKESAGNRFEEIELQCLTLVAQARDNGYSWLSEVAPAFGVTADQAMASPIVLVGTVSEIIETLELRRQQFGFSYWVIHQQEMEAFAPVVAALNGK